MEPEAKPPQYADVASAIEIPFLDAALPVDQLIDRCQQAARWQVNAVLVWPCHVDTAVRSLAGSNVAVGVIAGYPYGAGTAGSKLFEGRDGLRRGARIVEFTHNLSQMQSRHFQQVETELLQMAESCAEQGAEMRLNLETSYLDTDLLHVAFRIAKRIKASHVTTGHLAEPTVAALSLLLEHKGFRIEVKRGGAHLALDALRELQVAGIAKFALVDPGPLLMEWKQRLEAAAPPSSPTA